MTQIRSAVNRRELGDFLRSRRDRLRPEQVGVPATGRRRTPGLRREEVAVLAGVSLTWYTRLEQGRPINPSAQVLMAVARVLRLDETEQRHLRRLAGLPLVTRRPAEGEDGLVAALRPILDKLDPYPAVVQTASYDVLASNRAYRRLFTDLNRLPAAERNCAKRFFTDPDWRRRYVDADLVARRMVATLRAVSAADADRPETAALVGELRSRSEQFARLWSRHDLLLPCPETKRLQHPLVGALELEFVSTELGETGQRMTVMTPTDEVTARRLAQLSVLTALESEAAADGGRTVRTG